MLPLALAGAFFPTGGRVARQGAWLETVYEVGPFGLTAAPGVTPCFFIFFAFLAILASCFLPFCNFRLVVSILE